MKETRPYNALLRRQNSEATRRRIVDMALEMIREQPNNAVTHDGIAERTGIARRTIYNHFPFRDLLLEAVWKECQRLLGLSDYPETERHLLESVQSTFRRMDENASLVKGVLSQNAGEEVWHLNDERRRSGLVKALKCATSHLSNDERSRVNGVFLTLQSARTWETMRDQAKLKDGEPSQAVVWAMQTMLGALYEQKKLKKEGRHI